LRMEPERLAAALTMRAWDLFALITLNELVDQGKRSPCKRPNTSRSFAHLLYVVCVWCALMKCGQRSRKGRKRQTSCGRHIEEANRVRWRLRFSLFPLTQIQCRTTTALSCGDLSEHSPPTNTLAVTTVASYACGDVPVHCVRMGCVRVCVCVCVSCR
jgi:hypothetical protein